MLTMRQIGEAGWPEAMLMDIFEACAIEYMPEDIEQTIDYIFTCLNWQQRFALESRYRWALPYSAICKDLGVSDTRMAQITKKAIVMLRTSDFMEYLEFGLRKKNQLDLERRDRALNDEKHVWKERRRALVATVGKTNADAIIHCEIESRSSNIINLKLPTRAQNRLRQAGINTLEELCKLTVEELYQLRGVGLRTQQDILSEIQRIGLHLSSDEKKSDEPCTQKNTRSSLVADLEMRAYDKNCLLKHGIMTLSDLCQLTEKELYNIPGIGPKAVKAISLEMSKTGAAFKQEESDIHATIGKLRSELSALIGEANANAVIKYEEDEGTILIRSLTLRPLVRNQLELHGIKNLIALCRLTSDRLKAIPLFGEKALSEINFEMQRIGIALRQGG